jgi:hypothetical protein
LDEGFLRVLHVALHGGMGPFPYLTNRGLNQGMIKIVVFVRYVEIEIGRFVRIRSRQENI